ncbi:hypothetical protein ZOSMA_147G00220 [Zostera marina]|uniref:Uncharacterized protein n=1 Tax=Zostera marina TaxID=29655 RepID=A0A0K9PZ63_ZOSMR|nr:hypothetical protein ZOSMA_147G00220 [Zostera marina]
MDIDGMERREEVVSLNPELFQIPEVSMSTLKANPIIIDNLYMFWLSLPQTDRLLQIWRNEWWLEKYTRESLTFCLM